MLSTERKDFDEQLEVLFGGFTQFLTPNRKEAFWRGLQKMQLSMFARCVDYLLGDSGDDKLPTPNRIWQVSRQLRQRPSMEKPAVEQPEFDAVHAFGQRCLLVFLQQTPEQIDEAALQRLVAAKNKIVAVFRRCGFDDGEDAAEAMRSKLMPEFRRVMKAEAA